MYRRLPHGPNGMAREEVERNQRSRLYGAMVEAVWRNGYERTTVADVIALAGVSRRAFYELFAGKEECFVGTHEVMVALARRRLEQAWLSERGWENRMQSSCQSLLRGVAREPKGPRLVLLDSPGVGAGARDRMQLTGLVFERMIATAFSLAPGDVCYPQLTPRVVVAGVRHVISNRLLERRHGELAELSDEVLDWIESYRMAPGRRLRTLAVARPLHPPPSPGAFLTGDEPRARVLRAFVGLTLAEGYEPLADAQIAQFAGVSTEAFHRQFRDKEDCLLAVLDEFVAETLERVRPALDGAEGWEDGACRALEVFVAHLVAQPALLRIAFVNLFEAGPATIGAMTRTVAEFVAMLTEHAPTPIRAPQIAQEAVTGALWGLISTFVSDERLSRLPSLLEHLVFTVLAPYVGARPAVEALAGLQRSRPAA